MHDENQDLNRISRQLEVNVKENRSKTPNNLTVSHIDKPGSRLVINTEIDHKEYNESIQTNHDVSLLDQIIEESKG